MPAKAPRPEVIKPDHTPIEEVQKAARAILGDNIYLRYAVDKDRGHYTKCLLGVWFKDSKGVEKVILTCWHTAGVVADHTPILACIRGHR